LEPVFFSRHLTAFIFLSISQQGSPEFGRHSAVDNFVIPNKFNKIDPILEHSQQDFTIITQLQACQAFLGKQALKLSTLLASFRPINI